MISQYHERKKEEGIRKKEEPVNIRFTGSFWLPLLGSNQRPCG